MSRHASFDGVAVCCPVSVPYERHSTHTAHWWIGRALRVLCEEAGIRPPEIDGLSVSSFTLAPDTAVGLAQHLGLCLRALDHIPTGGASGVMALRRAARAVQAGDATMVACVAGDTNAPDTFRQTLSGFSRFAQDAAYPYGAGGPNTTFGLLTDHYMREFGVEPSDFGRLCVDQRTNALTYPHALMRSPLAMADYLDARMISDPIRLYDCVMPCAGAEAFVVTRIETAERLGLPYARALAVIERHNAHQDDAVQWRGGWTLDVDELYDTAGLAPADIDLVQTYDDYPVIVMMQLEDLGFCAKGEAAAFVRGHSFTADGSFPHNTSGGQLSVGQAGAAGGYLGLVEALRQVTGRSLSAPVADARRALVSGFGVVNYDRGVCTGAAILEAA
ncbi:MAG: thiolase family protein [Pseudomonadota bacterium]